MNPPAGRSTHFAFLRPRSSLAVTLVFCATAACLLPASAQAGLLCTPVDFLPGWSRTYSDLDSVDVASDMILDSSGNILVVGTSGRVGEHSDILTLKYSDTGDLLWERRFDGGFDDYGHTVLVDGSDAVYVLGRSTSDEQGASPPANIILKYDSAGNPLWTRTSSTVAGWTGQDLALDSGTLCAAFAHTVLKYTTDGVPVWSRENDHATSDEIRVGANHDVYVIGTFTGPGWHAAHVTRYSADGDSLWVRNSRYQTQEITSAAVAGDGRILAGGRSWDSFTGNMGAAYTCWNSQGTRLWDGTTYDVESVLFGPNGYAYVAGGERGFSGFSGSALVLRIDAGGNVDRSYTYGQQGDVIKFVSFDIAGRLVGTGFTFEGPNTGRCWLADWTESGVLQSVRTVSDPNRYWMEPVGSTLRQDGALFLAATDAIDYTWNDARCMTMRVDMNPERSLPPTFAFGLFSNPYLKREIRIVARASECIEAPSFTVNNVPVTPYGGNFDRLWWVEYNVSDSGPVHAKMCSTDGNGNSGCSEITFFATLVARGDELIARDESGRLSVQAVSNSSLDEAVIAVVSRSPTADDRDAVVAEWDIDPTGTLGTTNRTLAFSFDGLGIAPGAEAGLYFETGSGEWIPSSVELSSHTLTANTLNGGVIRVRHARDARSPALGTGLLTVSQNIPNPFNPSTSIGFETHGPGIVRVEVFDVAGRRVATVAERHFVPGVHYVSWNGVTARGNFAASGVYFYRVTLGQFSEVRRMVLLR